MKGQLDHAVFYVRDLQASLRFWRDLLGFKEVGGAFGGKAMALTSGRTHHELLLIEVGPSAAPLSKGRRLGLYHFGLKVGETDDELREARDALQAAGAKIVGASDHGVTHSLYIEDPDGNEIELYIDVQPARWKDDPSAVFADIKPLRL